MHANTSPIQVNSAGPAIPSTARAERHGQVVDIRPLLQERVNEKMIDAALGAMREAAARPGRARLRLVAGGER